VAETDTLDLFVLGGYLEFPVAGMDTLLLEISGIPMRNEDNHIEPVVVTGKRDELIDIGFGPRPVRSYNGIGRFLPMLNYMHLSSLKEYFQTEGQASGVFFGDDGRSVYIRGGHQLRLEGGEPIPALVILNGRVTDFEEVDASYTMREISSVMVMKVAPQYGQRGMGGAVVITTK
jgi:hypothetical protein